MVFLPVVICIEIDDRAALPSWCKEDDSMTSSEPESVEVDEKNIAALEEKARGGRSCNSISIETFECALNAESNGGEVSDLSTADLSVANCEVDKVPFFCGNRHIENTEGILHIYKPNRKLGDREEQQEEIDPNNPGFVASRIQCMLGVPAAMTSQNVLDFLAPFSESLMHIRFLRDSDPNSFMVLLKFKDEPSSMECYSYLNGRPFNSIEPDLCHLVFVSRVEVVRTSKGGSLPAAGYAEMPKCIVCLERLDETVLGLLTVPCNHSFHAACMKHWSDTTCPVCRHLITPGFTESQSCPVCGKRDDLWICLICGHVGCGRYANGHAYQHFQETQHTFALEVGGQRVWDYAGDNYVHRLIQSKSDGKLVEFNPGNNSIEATEKVEALNLEYSYLLSREMDAQRKYYEDRLTEFQEGAYIKISALEKEVGIIKENSDATKRLLRNVTTEKHNLEQKLALAKSKAEELMKLYREELELNSCLRRNQSDYSQKLNALQEELATLRQTKDKEIEALKDEVRDLMIHIESGARLAREDEATNEEIRQGHVFVPEESRANDQTSRRRTRGRRNRR
ncbi:zinc finger, C3HC4 type [Trichuris suis]|nr:zinc finger, C3HC4 type [Trichuris suis]